MIRQTIIKLTTIASVGCATLVPIVYSTSAQAVSCATHPALCRPTPDLGIRPSLAPGLVVRPSSPGVMPPMPMPVGPRPPSGHGHGHGGGFGAGVIGGLIGGAIIGAATRPAPPTVVYQPAPTYVQPVQSGLHPHDQFCLGKYKSYNINTKQYLSYSGVFKYCRSPYM